jgi:hypothetical protein
MGALFLRAGRETTGARTFKLDVGEPLQTSFGEDLYNKIFSPDSAVTIRQHREVKQKTMVKRTILILLAAR